MIISCKSAAANHSPMKRMNEDPRYCFIRLALFQLRRSSVAESGIFRNLDIKKQIEIIENIKNKSSCIIAPDFGFG